MLDDPTLPYRLLDLDITYVDDRVDEKLVPCTKCKTLVPRKSGYKHAVCFSCKILTKRKAALRQSRKNRKV